MTHDRRWISSTLLLLVTVFLFLGWWLSPWLYVIAVTLTIVSLLVFGKDTFLVPAGATVLSSGWLTVHGLLTPIVESLIDAESYGWIYLAFIGLVFCILAFWMWKRGWLHLSFFLLPVAMLLVQSEIFSGMPKENVVIVGILIVGGMFVAGGTLSWVLKEDRNRLLALGITVVLANGITSFINSFYRTIEGSFWANFSLIGGATTVFGLSLVAAPKLLALFSNAVTKRRDRKQHG